MRHRLMFFTIIMIGLLSVGLFRIKYRVQDLEKSLKYVNHDIFVVENSIHLLKVELSFLESPKRIQSLAEEHLRLKPITSKQYIGEDALPITSVPVHEEERRYTHASFEGDSP